MGLDIRGLAATAAAIGFSLAGNALVTITLHLGETTGAVYDPATDTTTLGAGSDLAVQALPFKRKDAQVRQTSLNDGASSKDLNAVTKTYLIQCAAVGAAVEIVEEDTLTDEFGDKWEILSASVDPGRGAWIIDARRA